MSSKLIIGPFFFEESIINQQNYLDMLKKLLLFTFTGKTDNQKGHVSTGWGTSLFLEDSLLLVA
jgi:hypothetical protein